MYNVIHNYYKIILYNTISSDIDECSNETDYCSQTCINTEGNFICGCNSGFLLDIDGTACNGCRSSL